MSWLRTASSDTHTCPLRGLTLCDGQVLEEPDGALTTCMCAAAEQHRRCGRPNFERWCLQYRDKLVAIAMRRETGTESITPF